MPKDVLVVEDEAKCCTALKVFFESKGFHVTTAGTGQAALDQVRRLSTEVVLLDLGLPDSSGLDLLTTLRQQFPAIKVIVISGVTDPETIQEALQRGASDYLTKPFDFARCFYAAMGLKAVDLTTVQPDPEAMRRVPISVAQQYQVVPLTVREGVLQLAMADPLDVQHIDELHALLECEIQPVAVAAGNIGEVLRWHYGIGAGVSKRSVPSSISSAAPQPAASASLIPVGEADAGIVQLVNNVLHHAITNRATDLHVGIGPDGPWVRERVDGVLYDVPVAPQLEELYGSIISRMKVMANLDIAEHRLPQDGRIWFEAGAVCRDLRLSLLPTPHGENVAIRVLEPSEVLQMEQLGLQETQYTQLLSLLAKPTGLLLVTGPTGSGKSTSLYAFLSKLNTGRVNIITIEDPIEHELPGVAQIQVQPKIGLSFANGLRSILRHDPDIIMVGEIRDQETASLAVRAALTGHLVLSTLHTNDAASGVTRLVDLGIEPFLLCSTLTGIISQRLIRVLCQRCREPIQVSPATLGPLGLAAPAMPHDATLAIHRARGCKACHGTGYHGRTGAFETLPIDHHIRSLVIKRTSSAQLKQSALSRGMTSLWQSGWEHVQSGSTSLEELARVLPEELR